LSRAFSSNVTPVSSTPGFIPKASSVIVWGASLAANRVSSASFPGELVAERQECACQGGCQSRSRPLAMGRWIRNTGSSHVARFSRSRRFLGCYVDHAIELVLADVSSSPSLLDERATAAHHDVPYRPSLHILVM
jgi:hypothetical protein